MFLCATQDALRWELVLQIDSDTKIPEVGTNNVTAVTAGADAHCAPILFIGWMRFRSGSSLKIWRISSSFNDVGWRKHAWRSNWRSNNSFDTIHMVTSRWTYYSHYSRIDNDVRGLCCGGLVGVLERWPAGSVWLGRLQHIDWTSFLEVFLMSGLSFILLRMISVYASR